MWGKNKSITWRLLAKIKDRTGQSFGLETVRKISMHWNNLISECTIGSTQLFSAHQGHLDEVRRRSHCTHDCWWDDEFGTNICTDHHGPRVPRKCVQLFVAPVQVIIGPLLWNDHSTASRSKIICVFQYVAVSKISTKVECRWPHTELRRDVVANVYAAKWLEIGTIENCSWWHLECGGNLSHNLRVPIPLYDESLTRHRVMLELLLSSIGHDECSSPDYNPTELGGNK